MFRNVTPFAGAETAQSAWKLLNSTWLAETSRRATVTWAPLAGVNPSGALRLADAPAVDGAARTGRTALARRARGRRLRVQDGGVGAAGGAVDVGVVGEGGGGAEGVAEVGAHCGEGVAGDEGGAVVD